MNKRNVERFLKKTEWVKKKVTKLTEKYIEKCLFQLKRAFDKIKKQEIEKWYSMYKPRYYHRTYDLYNIPRFYIIKKNNDWEFEFDENRMSHWHRVFKKDKGREYLYNITFAEGWHGGAEYLGSNPAKGYDEPHPEPGVPYWRTPHLDKGKFIPGVTYAHWTDNPAARSESPRDAILERFETESEEIEQRILNEYQEKLIEVVEKYNQAKAQYL